MGGRASDYVGLKTERARLAFDLAALHELTRE